MIDFEWDFDDEEKSAEVSIEEELLTRTESPDGTIEYRDSKGELHRIDGPAIEYGNGTNVWFVNGLRHRTDGPAIEFPDGEKWWYINGLRHRTEGPAVEHSDGTKEWWVNGIKIDPPEDSS